MKASNIVIAKIKEFEGLRLKTYVDAVGILTIGYGHTRGVRKGMTITPSLAEQYLANDIEVVERDINASGLPALRQGQFDALVSFVFNLGIGNFRQSTLCQLIKNHAPTADIQAQIKRWIYAGKIPLKGLIKRRAWEAKRWAE